MAGAASAAGWKASSQTDPETGATRTLASVVSDDGHRLTVAPGSGNSAVCTLTLGESSADTFTAEHPPLLDVDGGEPLRIVEWTREAEPYDDGGDFMEAARRRLRGSPGLSMSARSVSFLCWKGLARQTSPTWGPVRQLMDGREARFSYQPAEGGRAEVRFALDGAREAIAEALDIPVEPSETDLLQDTLLSFRIQYRSSTCYLLAGKKIRKRCLEAVNACAQQPQESIVDNLGCIEGE